MFLEGSRHGLERATDALFRIGIAAFLLAVSADGALHLTGSHDLEQAAHLAIFAGMALASVALVVRGSASQRKERSHVFDEPGVYKDDSSFHPQNMQGTVRVTSSER